MTYSPSDAGHLQAQRQSLRDKSGPLRIQLNHLGGQLKVSRARSFMHEGIGRRVEVIQRAIDNIFTIYPPDREAHLSPSELTDIGINLQAFAINIYAVFDNVAWVCMLEAGGNLAPLQVGLFKPQIAPFLSQSLKDYIAAPDTMQWFTTYAKRYRDSTAHRIPPYLPPAALTPADVEEARRIEAEAQAILETVTKRPNAADALQGMRDYEKKMFQRRSLGKNSPYMAVSASEPGMPMVQMHPQLLTDWMTVQELLQHFMLGLAQQHQLTIANVPEMRIGASG